MRKIKFIMTLNPEVHKRFDPYLKGTGVTLQELIRARVIPEWFDGPAIAAKRGYARGYKAGRKQNGNR